GSGGADNPRPRTYKAPNPAAAHFAFEGIFLHKPEKVLREATSLAISSNFSLATGSTRSSKRVTGATRKFLRKNFSASSNPFVCPVLSAKALQVTVGTKLFINSSSPGRIFKN